MTDLLALAAELSAERADAPLPVERWNPARCGTMDLVIRADGAWVHEGRPIVRPALVRLFSRVLRRDPDGYVLVTPAEKLEIEVEDAPFRAVDVDGTPEGLRFRTNVGDAVTASPDHPLTVRLSAARGEEVPYVLVRGGLEARLTRTAWFRLLDEAETAADGTVVVRSGGARFVLGSAS